MILEIDAGNTRIKWRIWQGESLAGYGVLLTANVAELGADVEAVAVPEQIRLGSVAGEEVTQCVRVLAEKWGSRLLLAKTVVEAAGVRCGYADPSAMGVDRWLAVIAAYHKNRGPCVVVDAGSAITVDLVDAAGAHLGGYIVPGFGLMRESLRCGTSDVNVQSAENLATVPGKTTLEAVNHGLLLMVVGLVEAALPLTQPAGGGLLIPQIIITGGDAETLLPVLSPEAKHMPHLVLDGLGLAVAP